MRPYQKIFSLFDRNQRRNAIALLTLMFIGMLLETAGVGLVIPAVAVMATQDIAVRYPAAGPWLALLGHPTQEQLVIGGMLALVGIYSIKAIFLVFLAWLQTKFIFDLHASLSQRLFASYLRQPYEFHLQRNSAQLIRNVITEVNLFTNAATASMILLTEGMVLLGITILLFIVEPWGTLLATGTLGFAAWIFHQIVRTRIPRWGKERQRHDGLRIQHVQQGLSGVKDIKLLGREADFLAQYRLPNYGNAYVLQRQHFFQQLPRLWLELLAVAALAIVVLVMTGQGKPLDVLLPTLGLFGAAAFRLMPSVNRLIGGVQSVRFALPVINTLHHDLVQIVVPAAVKHNNKQPFNNQLVLNHVNFSYPNTDEPALRNVSLTIPRGTSIGIIGGSGAGKSTLVDVILGLLYPTNGAVTVDQIDIQSNLRGWQDQIGYVPQTIYLTDDTLRRNVAFGLADDQINEAAVRRAIRSAQLEDFVNTLPEGLDTLVGERGVRLSGGQRQRIGIARALYHDPAVLVLDEATSSLDTLTERGVMEAIRAMHGDKTIIIIAHRLSTVEYCDRLYQLDRGMVVADGVPAEMLATNGVAQPA